MAEEEGEVNCFVCLDCNQNLADLRAPDALVRCCTQCVAQVHLGCWRRLRKAQRISALRARFLAQTRPDSSLCSICRSGTAFVEVEELAVDLNAPESERLQAQLFSVIGRLMNHDLSEEPPLCSVKCLVGSIFLVSVLSLLVLLLCLEQDSVPVGRVLVVGAYLLSTFLTLQLAVVVLLHRLAAFGPLIPETSSPDPLPSLVCRVEESQSEVLVAFSGLKVFEPPT